MWMLRHGKVGFFDTLSEVAVISLSTMIYSYAQNGFGRKALALFERMINLGLQPNDVTVLSVLLACKNSAEEGCEFFDSFRKDKITIELEYKRGETGNVSGIPEEHLSRKVIIYSPARTATQQGSGKLGKWKINFVSTLNWENPLMGWTSSTGFVIKPLHLKGFAPDDTGKTRTDNLNVLPTGYGFSSVMNEVHIHIGSLRLVITYSKWKTPI